MSASNGVKVLIGCLYKSPNGRPYNNQLLVELFGCKDFNKYDYNCIVGDFNFLRIDWSNLCTVSGDDKRLADAKGDAYLSQLVGRPTQQEPHLVINAKPTYCQSPQTLV